MDLEELKKLSDTMEDDYDSCKYDTENMITDARNGNLTLEDLANGKAEDYTHLNIVYTSMTNGQWSQARKQCKEYGLDFDHIKRDHAMEAYLS